MKYGKKIPYITDMDRTNAIILFNGKIYASDINHQCCIEDAVANVFSTRGWDMSNWSDMDKAVAYTDSAFRNNEMFGFDVYESIDEGYLVAHYPQNLEVEECFKIMNEFARKNNWILATFTKRDALSTNECRVVFQGGANED